MRDTWKMETDQDLNAEEGRNAKEKALVSKNIIEKVHIDAENKVSKLYIFFIK